MSDDEEKREWYGDVKASKLRQCSVINCEDGAVEEVACNAPDSDMTVWIFFCREHWEKYCVEVTKRGGQE